MTRRLLLTTLLILLAAALIIYNTHNAHKVDAPKSTSAQTQLKLPDWQGEQVTVWQAQQDRTITLHVNHALHFPDGKTLLEAPVARIERPERLDWLSARQGEQQGVRHHLSGQVRLLTQHKHDAPPWLLTSEQLTWWRDKQRIDSDTLVTIRQNDNWTRGTGMTLWLDAEQIELHHDVTSHYVPTP